MLETQNTNREIYKNKLKFLSSLQFPLLSLFLFDAPGFGFGLGFFQRS